MSALGPPTSSLRRAALLEQLITTLTTGAGIGQALPIKDRDPSDPTIALLDAWATVGDVLGFYLDRIAAEGYISSATEAGSILALANLMGQSPQLSIAASTYIAYQLQPDPTDTAVVLPAGLLTQSVPGVGQTAQTFQTADPLTARPSWGLMTPKLTRPLMLGDLTAPVLIVIAGTTANLQPNQVIVLDFVDVTGNATASSYTIASTTVDLTANTTAVNLLANPAVPPATASPPPAATALPTVESMVDGLVKQGLGKPTTPPPSSASQLQRDPSSVFGSSMDATPRILSALQPAIAPVLYQALGSSPFGPMAVTAASACQIQASPFGAQAAGQQVLDASGRPAGTRDWPIGGMVTLTLSMTGPDFANLLTYLGDTTGHSIQIEVACTGRTQSASGVATVAASHEVPNVHLGGPSLLGHATVIAHTHVHALTVTYKGGKDSADARFTLTIKTNPQRPDAVELSLTDTPPSPVTPAPFTWDPTVEAPVQATIGISTLSIVQQQSAVSGSGVPDYVTITIETPLGLENPKVLPLDSVYPGILAGSSVVIDRTYADGSSEAKPLITEVENVATVSMSAYGTTAKVTQLTLKDDWLQKPTKASEDDNLTQSALREITVNAQTTPLQPLPVPFEWPNNAVSGQSLELSTLVAGMEAGRLIAVTGQRADLLPAVVNSGEIAMVEGILTGAMVSPGDTSNTIPGDTPTTTLQLHNALSFPYVPSTVQIYGNIVTGQQGATITDVLGSGNPAVSFPTFTLSSGPLLSDPASASGGCVSTLLVTVDGVVYQEVERLDSSTPARSYVTGTNPQGRTTITFASPLPAGNGNVLASYRVANASQGNLAANQLTQMLSRPSAAQSVTNPLPATNGAGGAQARDVQSAAPVGMRGLGRLVSISDYADLAQSWAGVAKATARTVSDGRTSGVLVTVAGPDPMPIDPGIVTGLTAAIALEGDPTIDVSVMPAQLFMLVLAAAVTHDPLADWDAVANMVQAALVQAFAYGNRGLGEAVALGDLIAAAHTVPSVWSFDVTALALVPSTTTATQLATALPPLLAGPVPNVLTLAEAATSWEPPINPNSPPAAKPAPDGVAFMTANVPDTLLLTDATP